MKPVNIAYKNIVVFEWTIVIRRRLSINIK